MSDARADAARGDNLILIGARGSGKTVVGQALAQRLSRPFVDTDARIEQHAGCSVAEIFARWGEPRFRQFEREIIAAVAADRGQVISVGGGAVVAEVNRKALHRAGQCVWLMATPNVLAARLSCDPRTSTLRPPLTDQPPEVELRRVLAERVPYYASLADVEIDTDDQSIAEVVDAIAASISP